MFKSNMRQKSIILSSILENTVMRLVSLLINIVGLYAATNLICNGDFQSYTLNSVFQGDPYQEFNEDMNCWYNKYASKIKVKQKATASKGAQLVIGTSSYYLCQKVTLTQYGSYQLDYSLYCPTYLYNMNLYVTLNGNIISTLYISTSNRFGQKTVSITPNTAINEICFNQFHSNDHSYFYQYYIAGIVDNITLIDLNEPPPPPPPIPNNSSSNTTQNTSAVTNTSQPNSPASQTTTNQTATNQTATNQTATNQTATNQTTVVNQASLNQTNSNIDNYQQYQYPDPYSQYSSVAHLNLQKYVIYFETVVKEITWQILLVGDLKYQSWIDEYLTGVIQVKIDGEIQREFHLEKNQNGFLVIAVKIYRRYNLQNIQLIVDNQKLLQYLTQFQVYVDGKQIYFNLLKEDQKKIIEEIEPIVMILPDIVHQAYVIVSSSLCSYFILSLFNFWNLSLMYNFLILDTVPNFARNINEMMIDLLYQKGSVSDWIVKNFGMPEDTFNFDNMQGVSEKIQEFKQKYSWFGLFGFSSIAIVNNLDSFFACLLLIMKILALKLIIKCISKKIKKTLEITDHFFSFFLTEIIAVIPFIIVSAFININSSIKTYQEGRQKIFQIFLLFISFIVLPLWYLTKLDDYFETICLIRRLKIHKKAIKNKKIIKKIETLSNQAKIDKKTLKNTGLELLLNISIPGLIWLGNVQGFLAINTLVIVVRSVYFYKNFMGFAISDRIFGFIMNLVWIIHHFNYCLLYLLSILLNNELGDEQLISKIITYCGITAILTVLVGGSIELFRFICDIIIIIFILVKRVIKSCIQSKKSLQNDNQKNKQQKENQKNQAQIQSIKNKQLNSDDCFYVPVNINIKAVSNDKKIKKTINRDKSKKIQVMTLHKKDKSLKKQQALTLDKYDKCDKNKKQNYLTVEYANKSTINKNKKDNKGKKIEIIEQEREKMPSRKPIKTNIIIKQQ